MSAVPAPHEPAPTALSDDLGWALGVLFRAYVQTANAVMDDIPGGPRGFQVLTASVGDAPRTQLVLANRLGIDRTVMTYLLDDLEKAGLVSRQPDPADRRARRIVATDQGKVLLDDLTQRLRAAEDHILSGLAPDDRAAFRCHLQALAAHVNAVDPVRDACAAVADIDAAKRTGPC